MSQTLLYYLKFHRFSPLVAAEFFWNRTRLSFLKSRARPCLLTDKSFARSLKSENIEGFLKNLRARKTPLFFIDPAQKARLLTTFKIEFPSAINDIIADAERICSHTFDLLGSGPRHLGDKIDWHQDFKSGERWQPGVFYADTKVIKGNGSDIKVPWELSRFQHLPTLGKAYWLTQDEKYTGEFIDEISDWIDNNPAGFGVNWACTMEVAIRAVNWVWGYYFFQDSPRITDEFLRKFFKNLLMHGRHIMHNLERSWAGTNTNHYLADIVGLIYPGVLFPEFREAGKWRDSGVKELIKEMKRQVYADGTDYEGSISYHRLAAELFLAATLLCRKNGITFPDWYMKRLEKMVECVMLYSKPDGAAPQIGDNDDGRLHVLSNYSDWDRLDHRYLLAGGAVIFKRPDFQQATGNFPEDALWLLGDSGLKEFNNLAQAEKDVSSGACRDGGFYIMRRKDLYLIIDGMPAAFKAPSGHRHNSRLSFELFAGDKSFIIDPGAYVYTAAKEMRNLFRSTGYHNTVVVDNEEQNPFNRDEFFNMGHGAETKINRWQVTDKYDLFEGEHSGYKRLKDPVTHRRQIYFNKDEGYWIVDDIIAGKGEHRYDLYFHFAPLEVKPDGSYPLAVRTETRGTNLAVIPLEKENITVEIMDGWISYRYGVKIKAPVVKYSQKGYAPARFCNIIYPYTGEIDIGEVAAGAQKARPNLPSAPGSQS